MKITAEWLNSHNACPGQVAVFSAEWPEGAEIARAGLMRAAELGLDLDWLAERVLDAPARAVYDTARAQALAVFDVACAPARAVYYAIGAQALASYYAARVSALADALGLPAMEAK